MNFSALYSYLIGVISLCYTIMPDHSGYSSIPSSTIRSVSKVLSRESDRGNILMTGPNLSQLIGIDTSHGLLVGLFIILDRNLCSHSSHGMDTSAVTCLNQQFDIRLHKWYSHGNGAPIREHELRVIPKLLDHAKDVIPTTAVET